MGQGTKDEALSKAESRFDVCHILPLSTAMSVRVQGMLELHNIPLFGFRRELPVHGFLLQL